MISPVVDPKEIHNSGSSLSGELDLVFSDFNPFSSNSEISMFTVSIRPPQPHLKSLLLKMTLVTLPLMRAQALTLGVTDLHLHLELQGLCPQSELMDALGLPSRFLQGTHAYLRC